MEYFRRQYPPGTRIQLDYMSGGTGPIEPGITRAVEFVDDTGALNCKADNGQRMRIVPGEDMFHKTGIPLKGGEQHDQSED